MGEIDGSETLQAMGRSVAIAKEYKATVLLKLLIEERMPLFKAMKNETMGRHSL